MFRVEPDNGPDATERALGYDSRLDRYGLRMTARYLLGDKYLKSENRYGYKPHERTTREYWASKNVTQ